jgi:hypothetical protein
LGFPVGVRGGVLGTLYMCAEMPAAQRAEQPVDAGYQQQIAGCHLFSGAKRIRRLES